MQFFEKLRVMAEVDQEEEKKEKLQHSMTFSRVDPKVFTQCELGNASYSPPIANQDFELALWRTDQFGCVKLMFKYFNLDIPRGRELRQLNLHESLDKESILVVEEIDSASKLT